METPKDNAGKSPIPAAIKQCKCGKMASEHFDNGLSCGDDQCDDCHAEMVSECRQRSW